MAALLKESTVPASRHPSGPAARRARPTIVLGSFLALALAACGGATSSGAISASPSGEAPSVAPASSAPAESPSAPVEASPSASSSAGTAQELAITGTDFAFEAPASVPAGVTRVTLTNAGAEEHQAQVAGFVGEATFEDLTAALQGNDEIAALSMLTLSGGPTGVMPGDEGSTTAEMAPGQYVFLCFVRSPDGVPHFAKGMIAPIEVTEPATAGELPAGDAELALQDFAFVGLDTLTAGPHTVTVVNNGPQAHEATIVELAEGVTVQDLIPMFSSTEPPTGAPPFVSVGGVAGIAPGQTITMDVDLEAGNYAFLCFVPDPGTGQPHVLLGMVGGLTVE